MEHLVGKPPRQTDVGQAPLRDVSRSDGGCDHYFLFIVSKIEQLHPLPDISRAGSSVS